MVEVLIALILFTVAIAAYSGAVASTSRSEAERRAASLAAAAARDIVERIRATPASQRFASFNADPSDDPLGVGTAPGCYFAVEGLALADGDPDGFAGEIEFPLVGGVLREDSTDARLGMPRDLNGDTIVDENSRANDYAILPVRARVEYRMRDKLRTFEIHTELVDWTGGAP